MFTSDAGRRSAVVAGGGIAGLAAAIGLHRAGWSVTVLERAPVIGEVGAGWSFAPNAVRAIDALGLGDEFRAISEPSQAASNLRTPSGRYLMRFRPGQDQLLLANHRADLQRLLLNRLPLGTVLTGSEVIGLDESADKVTVNYRTGRRLFQFPADLVVAADGIHSAIRRSLWPAAPPPVYQRITCWRGVTEPGSVWPMDGFQTWGRGQRVGVHPLGKQRVYWFLAIRQPRAGVAYADDPAEVRRRIGRWHDPIPALLDATRPEHVLRNDIYDLDPLPTYVHGRVVLVGDAAHAMTPFLAQGAGQSLEDAVVLAGAAGKPHGLASYDAVRRPRTQQVVRMARADPKYSLSTGVLAYPLLTGLTWLASSAVAQRKAARLWRWQPLTERRSS